MDSYDFEIYQGSTFSLNLTLNDSAGNPIDLTNHAVSGFLKFRYSDTNKLADLNASKVQPYESGFINLTIPASGTAALPITVANYDVEIYQSGNVDKVLRGRASIVPEATY